MLPHDRDLNNCTFTFLALDASQSMMFISGLWAHQGDFSLLVGLQTLLSEVSTYGFDGKVVSQRCWV